MNQVCSRKVHLTKIEHVPVVARGGVQAESAEVAVGLELELHVECSTEHIITSRDVSRITEVEGGAAPCTFSDHGVVPHSSLDGGFVCFYGSRTWNTRRSVDLDLLTHVPVGRGVG